MNVDHESESECPVSLCPDFEGDFGQTIELLEIDIEEIQVNVEHSLEEVEGKKQFPCGICKKYANHGNSYANWKEYFHPCEEQKILFLMLIHLPQRLIGFLKEGKDDQEISKEELALSPHEYRPLLYFAGYVIRSFYQKRQNCSRSNSPRIPATKKFKH